MVWYEPKENILENEGGAALLEAYEAAAAAYKAAEAAEAGRRWPRRSWKL